MSGCGLPSNKLEFAIFSISMEYYHWGGVFMGRSLGTLMYVSYKYNKLYHYGKMLTFLHFWIRMKTLKGKSIWAIPPATTKTIRRTKHEPQVGLIMHDVSPWSPQMKWLLVLALLHSHFMLHYLQTRILDFYACFFLMKTFCVLYR